MTGRTVVLCASPTFGRFEKRAFELIEEVGAEIRQIDRAGLEDARVLKAAVGLIVGTEPVTERTFDLTPNLRVVAKHGIGTDNIDLLAAEARRIAVTNSVGANATAVAEMTIGLILALARGIVGQVNSVRSGRWEISVGVELNGSTLGIIGMGDIGARVAALADQFGMSILYTDVKPVPNPVGKWLHEGSFTTLDHLLEQSDFVSLHTPLTPETRHMIAAPQFARMRENAFLVNTARGGLVDELALLGALNSSRIAGAALDVMEDEPPVADDLIQHARVLITPHIAAYTTASLAKTSMMTAANIVAVLTGQPPPMPVTR